MARGVNFEKKVEKLKRGLDDLLSEVNGKLQGVVSDKKVKISDIDLEEMDDISLMQIQQKISQLLILRTKGKENKGE